MPLTKEKQVVIKAINDMGRRVSAADIATKTGLPVSKSTQTLNQIAEETSGHLQVSAVGDIAYQFPLGYQSAYLSHGIKKVIEQFNNKLFEVGFFLLRISFGIMLILSLVTIVLLFFVVITAMSRGRDSRDDGDGFAIDLDFFDWLFLRDLLYWQTTFPDYSQPQGQKTNKTNFLYNCFSFLFGDGNPNINLEERRWHAIAQLIRQNRGAITIEQLAPYTGKDPGNEDNVLPVLVRFDGRPTVSDTGNIIYLFPALQVSATQQYAEKLPPYLQTFPWKFSPVDSGSLIWVMILAAINFIGSWYLYFQAASLLPSLVPILIVLVVYGTLFVAIPISRYIAIQVLNSKMDRENELKERYASQLIVPKPELKKKLQEAEQMLLESRQIKTDNLVYDTDKELLEQEFPSATN
jgi:hypothetical protein